MRDERLVLNASRDGNVAEVKRLLLKGVSPNFKDHLGSTSLTEATIRRDTNMIELLLNMGANPDMSDSSGRTALCILHSQGERAEGYCQIATPERSRSKEGIRIPEPYSTLGYIHWRH